MNKEKEIPKRGQIRGMGRPILWRVGVGGGASGEAEGK